MVIKNHAVFDILIYAYCISSLKHALKEIVCSRSEIKKYSRRQNVCVLEEAWKINESIGGAQEIMVPTIPSSVPIIIIIIYKHLITSNINKIK